MGGCEGCSGWGIGVTAGAGNVVKANVVERSLADGINVAAPGTWIGLNVALRNGALGIEAVPGVRDGGGNWADGNAAQCSGVRCSAAGLGMAQTGGTGQAELAGDQLVGAAAGAVVVGDRDHDHLLRAVLARRLLDAGLATCAGVPTIVRRRSEIPSPSEARKRSAMSGGGTAIRRPRRSIVNAIRLLVASRVASSSVSAASAQTATTVCGASSRTPSAKPRR